MKAEPSLADNRLAMGPAEAARALGVSRATLWRLLAAGALQARRSGARTLVDAESVRSYWRNLPPWKAGERSVAR